jgi:SAM-dependent methyltransferase
MPELDKNLEVWNQTWDWSRGGEEWSDWWGGTAPLWYGGLLPRVHPFIPTGTILEIGPGFGRWTQFLKDYCERLVIVDLAERCIRHCRRRFANASNIEFHVNDGRSLGMVEERSIDFAFSFDSLVHADDDVVGAYLEELATKLSPDGVGFLHHSNAGRYRVSAALARRAPSQLRESLVRRGILVDVFAWRSERMTADRFKAQCDQAGLRCVGQELINWETGRHLIDALSIVTVPGSRWERPLRVIRNPRFRREAERMARLYAPSSYADRRETTA